MKKKAIALIAALACTFALCFTLVGCGGNSADAAKNFQGDWDIVSLKSGGEEISEKDLKTMASLGLEVTLSFNEDGTMALDVMGEKMEGKWEAKDATTANVTIDGGTVEAKLDGDKLSMTAGEDEMTFKKAETKAAKSSSSEK